MKEFQNTHFGAVLDRKVNIFLIYFIKKLQEVLEADKPTSGASIGAETTDHLTVSLDGSQSSRRKREADASAKKSATTLVLVSLNC